MHEVNNGYSPERWLIKNEELYLRHIYVNHVFMFKQDRKKGQDTKYYARKQPVGTLFLPPLLKVKRGGGGVKEDMTNLQT